MSLHLAPAGSNGWAIVREESGVVRPDPVHEHEHFGYADGVSHPGVRGTTPDGPIITPSVDPDRPDQGAPGQDLLRPGEFVLGFPGQDNQLGDPDPGFAHEGAAVTPPVPSMDRGAYMVFRRLQQRVPELDASVRSLASSIAAGSDPATPELLGAQLVGRWKSSAPLELTPFKDDLSLAEGTPRENDVEFGDDRSGLRCPFAAHVREAYPRDDVLGKTTPAPIDVRHAEAFSQTHRMMRRGIAFGPELSHSEAFSGHTTQQRGLLSTC